MSKKLAEAKAICVLIDNAIREGYPDTVKGRDIMGTATRWMEDLRRHKGDVVMEGRVTILFDDGHPHHAIDNIEIRDEVDAFLLEEVVLTIRRKAK